MTRAERTRLRAFKLERRGMRLGMRSTGMRNPFGIGAIRAGRLASEAFRMAGNLFQYALELEECAKREKKKRPAKMQKDWWR